MGNKCGIQLAEKGATTKQTVTKKQTTSNVISYITRTKSAKTELTYTTCQGNLQTEHGSLA